MEIALKCAVLNICAMNDRKCHIDIGDEVRAELFHLLSDKLHFTLAAYKYALGTLLEKCGNVLESVDVHELFARPELVALGHVYGNDVVFLLVYARHCLNSGNYGNFVLDALTAE